ncbi:hypothetical protein HPB47_010824, partial [Ixodes persulcatus]
MEHMSGGTRRRTVLAARQGVEALSVSKRRLLHMVWQCQDIPSVSPLSNPSPTSWEERQTDDAATGQQWQSRDRLPLLGQGAAAAPSLLHPDTVSATTAIDGHFGPHLEPPICHICMRVVTRGVVVQSSSGRGSAVPESPQQAEENSADVAQQLRQWCSTPTEDETPSPLSLERDVTPEPSEPGASPSDTSYTEADFVDPDLLDESYRPDNSFNSDDEPDSSDSSIWSNDSVHSDGIGSKMAAAGKTKKNSILNAWVKTVRGHVYWCAQTSSDNGALVLAKWVSVMRHVSNVHQHPSPLYP